MIKDFDEDAEEDVFDEHSSSTPSGSPVEEKSLEETLYHQDKTPLITDDQLTPRGPSIHVVDIFISPSVDLRAAATSVTTQMSNEDSAYDSDNQDAQTTTIRTTDVMQDSDDSTGSPRTNLRNRRAKLSLQRAHAVEIAESEALITADTQSQSNGQGFFENDDPIIHKTSDADTEVEVSRRIDSPTESRLKPLNIASFQTEPSGNPIDLVFRWIDSPWIQFFIGFAMSATAISLVADIPPIYLVIAVAIMSIVCFAVLENRLKAH